MLETKRCRLNDLTEFDYNDIKKLYIDEKVRRYLGGIIDAEKFQTKFTAMCHPDVGTHYWVIRHKQNNQFIGLISLDLHHDGKSKEVSYQLLPEWWGMGYAIEVVSEVIRYAFNELNLNKIVAETQKANHASCKLLEKVGMRQMETVERYGEMQAIYCIDKDLTQIFDVSL